MNLKYFIEHLEKADSTQKAKSLLNKYLAAAGFQYYAFTYYSGHIKTGRKLNYHCVSTSLRPWHEYYLEQGYADVDRTLERSSTMVLPIFWDVHLQLKQAKSRREKRMRLESIEFGIDKGLSIPIHGPNYDFATLTLHQIKGEKSLENYLMKQAEWHFVTLLFYHHIKRILNLDETDLAYHLTKREKQCLELTSKFWRVEQIAKELHITPRTVNFHLQNANKKLGTNNKYQAINKYLQFSSS